MTKENKSATISFNKRCRNAALDFAMEKITESEFNKICDSLFDEVLKTKKNDQI